MESRPIIFLDFDDVIVLNRPGEFGGYDMVAANPPPELWAQFFHPPAIQTLIDAIEEHDARVVITTSWLRFVMRDGFERIFNLTGFDLISARLHQVWDAPQNRGETRASAINKWLAGHHRGEPYVILDDELSGTGLRDSVHDRQGRVVLCKQNIGLHRGYLGTINKALVTPPI